jgi:hypothetical protein
MVDATARDIVIFGRFAGRLVAENGRNVFHAADPTLWELDRRSFNAFTEAEKAVHQAWVRRVHRGASQQSCLTDISAAGA